MGEELVPLRASSPAHYVQFAGNRHLHFSDRFSVLSLSRSQGTKTPFFSLCRVRHLQPLLLWRTVPYAAHPSNPLVPLHIS